jgi:mevalonate kinase
VDLPPKHDPEMSHLTQLSQISLAGAIIGIIWYECSTIVGTQLTTSINSMNTPTTTTTNMKATVSITKPPLHNLTAKHHKQPQKTTHFPEQDFTTASFCSKMTPSPSPSPKVPASSSKVTQEEQHSKISIETLEETIDFIKNMEDWKKEFFQESKKNLEQIIETWSDDSSTVELEELSKVMAEYNKMMKSIEQMTDEIKASVNELAKSKANGAGTGG